MKFWHMVLASLIVAGLLVVNGSAAEKKAKNGGAKPTAEEVFKKLDKDGDGMLTLDEFVGKRDKAKMEPIFKKLDKNNDGKLSLEEFKAMHERRGAKKQ